MKTAQEKRENMDGPDVLFVNFLGRSQAQLKKFADQHARGSNKLRDIEGLSK